MDNYLTKIVDPEILLPEHGMELLRPRGRAHVRADAWSRPRGRTLFYPR
jgi:hypothetical protein